MAASDRLVHAALSLLAVLGLAGTLVNGALLAYRLAYLIGGLR